MCVRDGCGGMRVAHGVTLESDLSDLSDLSDKMGGVSVYPVGLLDAVWSGSGEDVPLSSACLMAAAICESAGAWHNKNG